MDYKAIEARARETVDGIPDDLLRSHLVRALAAGEVLRLRRAQETERADVAEQRNADYETTLRVLIQSIKQQAAEDHNARD